jgi:hypothetical protein
MVAALKKGQPRKNMGHIFLSTEKAFFSRVNGSFGFRRMQRQRLPHAAFHNTEKVW